jgi:hypothetical protein
MCCVQLRGIEDRSDRGISSIRSSVIPEMNVRHLKMIPGCDADDRRSFAISTAIISEVCGHHFASVRPSFRMSAAII